MSSETLTMTATAGTTVVLQPRRGCSVGRYYDPQTGQFISVDPAVDQTEAPYAYVNGDPVDGADPLGLGCSFFGTLDPFSSNNCINQWAASGSPSSEYLRYNPALWAINGYANEASAWEQGCSLWTVAKYGAEGAAGVVTTGLTAAGGVVLVRFLSSPDVFGFLADETGSAGGGYSRSRIGELARRFGASRQEVGDAIHALKDELPGSTGIRNPDLFIDENGEAYPIGPNGRLGDSLGNIRDFLP